MKIGMRRADGAKHFPAFHQDLLALDAAP